MEIKKVWYQLSLKIGTKITGFHQKAIYQILIFFLTKVIKLDTRSKILDIGCGRAKIIGSLSSKLKLRDRPIGIDLVSHKDKDKELILERLMLHLFF